MLKFNNYPPEKCGDIDFSSEVKDSIKDLGASSNQPVLLGKNVGKILMANLTEPNIGTAVDLAGHLAENTESLRVPRQYSKFLHGVLDGAIEERSSILRANGEG